MKNNNDYIIEVKDLAVRYDGRTIVENVNFKIRRGEIFLIVGGSGSGKSTILRQLIGLERPDEGTIIVNGKDFTRADNNERQQIMKGFGVLFQSGGLFASMTLAENIALPLQANTDLNEQEILEMIEMKLAAVGLGGYEGFLPSEISGGMKKRAAFARALALDPMILFFDEPSSGLDPMTSASIDELIKDMNQSLETTMIIVSHDLESILSIADNIIMIGKDEKTIIAEGPPDKLKEMKDNETVYKFFNRKPNLNVAKK